MRKIIGLLPGGSNIQLQFNELELQGLSSEDIHILNRENNVRDALGCEPFCKVRDSSLLGALIGITIYAVFGLVAAWCECNLLGYGGPYGIFTLVGGILAGLFVGGSLGALVGLANSESGAHLYIQGVRMGDEMVVIEVPDQKVEIIKNLLIRSGLRGVKVQN